MRSEKNSLSREAIESPLFCAQMVTIAEIIVKMIKGIFSPKREFAICLLLLAGAEIFFSATTPALLFLPFFFCGGGRATCALSFSGGFNGFFPLPRGQ